jgi:hypothetical protein
MSEPVTVHVARFNDPMPDPALLAERAAGDRGPRIFAWPEPEPEAEAEIG